MMIILSPKASLEGEDLKEVYYHVLNNDPELTSLSQFKKNENLGKMAKSMLKHRIQNLTGKSVQVLEKEMGIVSETGLDVETLRKLAHFLILKANGVLPSTSFKKATPPPPQKMARRSMPLSTPVKTPGRRKTIAPVTASIETVECRLSPKQSLKRNRPKIQEDLPTEDDELMEEDDDDDEEEPKFTQAMLDVRAKKSNKLNSTTTNNNGKNPTPPKKKAEIPPKMGFTGATILPSGSRNEVYLVQSDPIRLDIPRLKYEIPSCPGFSLCCVHTPDDWMSPETYLAIDSLVKFNYDSDFHSFLLLIKATIENGASIQTFLHSRFTSHIQLLTFHCSRPSITQDDFKLLETTSNYFLAYFFPGCLKVDSIPPTEMFRAGYSTLISGTDEEDLENKLVDVFTEPGDWIADVAGAGVSEIILSAQKGGRNGVMIDQDDKALEEIQEKMVKIANFHDKTFRKVDGDVIQLN